MGDDDDGSSRRSSPLDRSPRSPASRLGNARIANALACAPVTTESRDANARSAGPADDARETDGEDGSPAHRMSVYIGTWNVGNTAPRMDAAKAWLAPARGHAIVAVEKGVRAIRRSTASSKRGERRKHSVTERSSFRSRAAKGASAALACKAGGRQ